MTGVQISIQNARGTVVFGREGYILHALDTGASILAEGITAGREVTFSGYILSDLSSARARRMQLENLSRRVRRIVTDAEGFTLTVGDRCIRLIAKSAPVFAQDAPLNADEARLFTVHARAARPSASYFSGTADTLSSGTGFEGRLIFPLSVQAGTVFGRTTSAGSFPVQNPGDVPCGFIASVTARTGDVDGFTLCREDGGEIAVSYPIPEGESIVIDTREGKKTVSKDGVPILSALSWDSRFFTLEPGETTLLWSSVGTGTVSVSVRLTPLYH